MASEVLQVTTVDSPDQWLLGAGANKVVAVNAPNDDYTSYIISSNANDKERYVLADPVVIKASDVISSVTVRARCIRGGADTTARVNLILGGSTANGATKNVTGSWADAGDVFTSKPGGGSWALQDVKDVKVEVEALQGIFFTTICTTLDVSVDYAAGNPQVHQRI